MTESAAQMFGGPFAGERDRARLTAQVEKVRAWAIRVEWFTDREAREQLERIYAPEIFPENSIASQRRNLKKRAAGKLRCTLEKRRRQAPGACGRGVWEYRLRPCSEAHARTEIAAPVKNIRWPATMEELENAGYGYTGTSKECGCGKRMLWFITPNRKWMPLSAVEGLRLVPHPAVCENAKPLRIANLRQDTRAVPRPRQAALF
jgi:hypothetical protein